MITKHPIESHQGGSRAAKKRAKKRKNKQKLQHQDVHTESTEEVIQEIPPSKKKKMQLPLSDSEDDAKQDIQRSEKKKSKKKEKKVIEKIVEESVEENEEDVDMGESQDSTDEEEIDQDAEEQVIDEVLSQLNPIEILFPERLVGNADDEEDANPMVLIEHIETKKRARALFESILAPSGISVDEFYENYWEKKPLLITKSKNMAEIDENEAADDDEKIDPEELNLYRSRLNGFLSKKNIEQQLREHPMRYGKDLNVTNFCNTGHGEKFRITLDQLPDMNGAEDEEVEYVIAEENDVWQNFENGCTVRLLCPHKHNDEVHALLSNMEFEFGCMVGSNAYLTPGGAENQGFAPHYDDIEAFILQLEGYKHWLVYPPMNKAETLPRESSRDFTAGDMKDVDPVIDVELGPGDMLYMPRGWVHQANTCRREHHSLHLTMSAMQNWAWVDFLEMIMPEALDAASSKSTSMRGGLPRNFLSYMGTMHEQVDINSDNTPEALRQLASKDNGDDEDKDEQEEKARIKKLQDAFKAEAKKKIMRVCKEAIAMVTTGCDQIAKRFLSDRLPPAFTPQELALTSDNRAENGGKIWPNTLVRLAKPGIAHLVIEDDKAVLYHCVDNSRVYHENPLSPLEFEIDDAPALEALITTVEPHWICVKDLIHGDIEDKMDIAQSLYDEGILAIFQDEAPDTSVQTG